ncbi:hypothetical protein BC829DRAFT_389416, partial [Chytridium lagenaria]
MASAADVRDILSLPHSALPPAPRQRPQKEVHKRPDGITRELFALTGGLPPLNFSVVPNAALKPKITFGSDGKEAEPVKWKWCSFKNPGRLDELELYHWVKERNRSISIPDFTPEEYQQHLEDPDWTYDETKYLLELCNRFDLRFIVISDHFEYEAKSRSIEDLKERYYSVTKKILGLRNDTVDPEISQYTFNKEELLNTELRRREQSEKKWAADRDRILKLFANNELATPVNMSALQAGGLKKIKKLGKPEDASSATEATPNPLRKDRKSSMKLIDDSVETAFKKEKIPPGVYLRTSRLFTPKANIVAKVKEVMDEYKLPAVPTIPTAAVCEKFDTLRINIVNLLELKKLLDRQEHEVRVLENRRDLLLQGGATPSASVNGSGISDTVSLASSSTAAAGATSVKKLKKRTADGAPPGRDVKRQKSTV